MLPYSLQHQHCYLSHYHFHQSNLLFLPLEWISLHGPYPKFGNHTDAFRLDVEDIGTMKYIKKINELVPYNFTLSVLMVTLKTKVRSHIQIYLLRE